MFDLSQHKGILLDLGCGANKQKGFVGMDLRDLPGVDIVHDLEDFPWPLPDDCCLTVVGSHIVEHIKPWFSIPLLDEVWRVLRLEGNVAFSMPYAGSPGFWQDPTHCNGWSEVTWQYFDPMYPLYQIYKPKPWFIKLGYPVWSAGGNLEVIMEKISEEQAKEAIDAVLKKMAGPEEEAGETLGISVEDSVKAKEAVG